LPSALTFSTSLKEEKITALPEPGTFTKFPQNLSLISLLFTTGKLFKAILKQSKGTLKKETCLMQVNLDFVYVTTLICTRLTDNVTLNFNSMFMAAVFLYIKKASDTT
jgi:hypothetical protein